MSSCLSEKLSINNHTHTHTHIYIYIYIYIYSVNVCYKPIISSFIPLIGLKFSESILFKFKRVFIYLLSKNITMIKKNIFNKSFFSEKSRTRIIMVNITSVFQEFYT